MGWSTSSARELPVIDLLFPSNYQMLRRDEGGLSLRINVSHCLVCTKSPLSIAAID